jgi:hypothetical protein
MERSVTRSTFRANERFESLGQVHVSIKDSSLGKLHEEEYRIQESEFRSTDSDHSSKLECPPFAVHRSPFTVRSSPAGLLNS